MYYICVHVCRQNYLFWTDYQESKIWRSNLDGSQRTPITETGQGPGIQ